MSEFRGYSSWAVQTALLANVFLNGVELISTVSKAVGEGAATTEVEVAFPTSVVCTLIAAHCYPYFLRSSSALVACFGLYAFGIGIYAIGSNTWAVNIGKAIAGVGSGGLLFWSEVALIEFSPPANLRSAIKTSVGAWSLGLVLSPLLESKVAEGPWLGVSYAKIVASAIAVVTLLKDSPRRLPDFDHLNLSGSAAAVESIASCIYMFAWSYGSHPILRLSGCLAVFLKVAFDMKYNADSSIMQQLWRNRTRLAGYLTIYVQWTIASMVYACLCVHLRDAPQQSSQILAPISLVTVATAALVAVLNNWFHTNIGIARPQALIGWILMGTSFSLLSRLPEADNKWIYPAIQLAFGTALGLSDSTPAILTWTPDDEAPRALLLHTSIRVGAVITGIQISKELLTRQLGEGVELQQLLLSASSSFHAIGTIACLLFAEKASTEDTNAATVQWGEKLN